MTGKLLPVVAGVIFCLLVLAGCKRDESIDPQGTGYVEANHAYRENFGDPPQGERGYAFARVAYLPLRSEPEKLRAIPVFLFTKQDQLRLILERMVSGKLLVGGKGALYNPFPDQLEMRVADGEGPTTSISLHTEQPWAPGDQLAGCRALAETALQFDGVEHVIILVNGSPDPQMPAAGFVHTQDILARVEDPSLVMIAGAWEEGEADPDEILVEFDRPVKVKKFQLFDQEGQIVDGDTFISVFRMAVVVHPRNPGRFHEGSLLRAEWEVVDELGRGNSGTSRLPLQRLDH